MSSITVLSNFLRQHTHKDGTSGGSILEPQEFYPTTNNNLLAGVPRWDNFQPAGWDNASGTAQNPIQTIRLTTGPTTISGWYAVLPIDNNRVIVHVIADDDITLLHESGFSAAANRFRLPTALSITTRSWVMIYDTIGVSRWWVIPTVISHDDLLNVSANDHHAQLHTLASHSTRPHSDLTGIGADDHHTQVHTLVSHSTRPHSDLTGIGADDHHTQVHTLVSHSTRPHSDLTGIGADDHHAQSHDHSSASDNTNLAPATIAVNPINSYVVSTAKLRMGTVGTTIAAFASQIASGAGSGAFIGLFEDDGAAMAAGDRLGGFLFGGSSSNAAVRNAAAIVGYATNNWTDGSSYPSALAFETIPSGSTARIERTRIGQDGLLDHQYGLRLSNVGSPTQILVNTDNYNPTNLEQIVHLRINSDAARNLTGIVAPSAGQGKLLILSNVGAFTITLTHDATSTAANRFLCPGSINFSLTVNKSVILIYDGTSSRWRIIG